jgi:formamidopyrimidine-DNA glycosylase
VLTLSQDVLLIHLRMSGDLRIEAPPSGEFIPLLHDRAVFVFKDGWRLVFNDPRKFGRIWLVQDPQTILGKLGPEPLDPAFTAQEFHRLLQQRHRQIKPLLMDQSFLAGLGNIYADEALYKSHLHPLRLADGLALAQSESLLAAIHEVLEEGIRRNGASIDWVYRGGSYQNTFMVYQRTGQPCYTCGTPIERALIGQRGTHFCPVCQPAVEQDKK